MWQIIHLKQIHLSSHTHPNIASTAPFISVLFQFIQICLSNGLFYVQSIRIVVSIRYLNINSRHIYQPGDINEFNLNDTFILHFPISLNLALRYISFTTEEIELSSLSKLLAKSMYCSYAGYKKFTELRVLHFYLSGDSSYFCTIRFLTKQYVYHFWPSRFHKNCGNLSVVHVPCSKLHEWKILVKC